MLKKIAAVLLSLALLLTAAACSRNNGSADATGKINVSVSFNALREFVLAVGGDKVSVTTIIPNGTEPHDFEPKGQDLADLSKAKIFVINGLGMEPWAEDTAKAVNNSGLITVDASEGIETITNKQEAAVSEHGQYDPHIWLSLKCAAIEARNIKNALVQADPANSSYYENNLKDYSAALQNLYTEYAGKFAAVSNKSFVTGHAAFAYLCREFSLNQNSVEDVFAEGEPSAQQLTELIEYCKANHVTTIFSEAFENAEVAETLAREAGAQVKSIYTIESDENGQTYLQRMEENLRVIYDSLK